MILALSDNVNITSGKMQYIQSMLLTRPYLAVWSFRVIITTTRYSVAFQNAIPLPKKSCYIDACITSE